MPAHLSPFKDSWTQVSATVWASISHSLSGGCACNHNYVSTKELAWSRQVPGGSHVNLHLSLLTDIEYTYQVGFSSWITHSEVQNWAPMTVTTDLVNSTRGVWRDIQVISKWSSISGQFPCFLDSIDHIGFISIDLYIFLRIDIYFKVDRGRTQ